MGPRRLELDDLYRIPQVSDPQLDPAGEHVAYVVTRADRESDDYRSHIWLVGVDDGDPRVLTAGGSERAPRWSPDGRWIAHISRRRGKPEAWLLPVAGGEARPLPGTIGTRDLVWSPDGTCLALVVETDDDRAPTDPVVVRLRNFKLDGAGIVATRQRRLAVCEVGRGRVRALTDASLEVESPAWAPDGESVAFTAAIHADSDLDARSDVMVVPAGGGEARRVTRHEGVAKAPVFSPDGSRIVFVGSDRLGVGHDHLYVVAAEGGRPQRVAADFDRNLMTGSTVYPGARPQFCDRKRVLFCAREHGCTHVFVVSLDGGDVKRVAGSAGSVISGLSLDRNRRAIAYVESDSNSCGEIVVAQADGSEPRHRTRHVGSALPGVELFVAEGRTFHAPDGTPIEGWLLRGAQGPAPLLLDIHGGPHNAWNPAFDGVHLYHQVLVAAGWNVVILNTRGSDGYGEKFYAAVTGAWGEADAQDFTAAVDALVDEGTADPSRLAVAGYSYGGFMTNWLTSQSDRWRAAVTGGCISNLVSDFGTSDSSLWSGRFELGATPYEYAERLREMSPLTHVDGVETPTLILHGEADDRCPIGQAEEWFTALRSKRVDVEFVRYPGGSHLFFVTGRPSHRIDFNRRIVDWLLEHCG